MPSGTSASRGIVPRMIARGGPVARALLAALVLVLSPLPLSAQVVIVDGSAPCPPAPPCPPCAFGVVCAPCPSIPTCESEVRGEVRGEARGEARGEVGGEARGEVGGAVQSDAYIEGRGEIRIEAVPIVTLTEPGAVTLTGPREEVRPVVPSPGHFAVAYQGGWDGIDVLSGGALRFTGHLDDLYFLEVTLGGMGRSFVDGRTLVEVPILLGFRVMGPLVDRVLRLHGVLASGVLIRTATGEPGIGAWGGLPIELGGGLEVGAPIAERMSIGVFVDVRGIARIPFEREPASVGVGWSAGLAVMWF